MDQLELRRITLYPCVSAAEIVVLVGTFRIPAGLRVAEASISSKQARIVNFSCSFSVILIRTCGLLFTCFMHSLCCYMNILIDDAIFISR